YANPAATPDYMPGALFSENPSWIEGIRDIAERQFRLALHITQDHSLLGADPVAELLIPLRPFFTGYLLYSMIVPAAGSDAGLELFARIGATRGSLALMPRGNYGLTDIIDPFPPIQSLADMPVTLPGVVFWSSLGSSCAMSAQE